MNMIRAKKNVKLKAKVLRHFKVDAVKKMEESE